MATRSLEDRVTSLEKTVEGLQNLPNGLTAFRQEVNTRFDELYAHMRLLHEDLVTRIQRLGEGRDDSEPPTPSRRKRGPKR